MSSENIHTDPWVPLARYVANDLSTEERGEVESWIARDPNRAAAVNELRASWNSTAPADRDDVNTDLALNRFLSRVDSREGAIIRRKSWPIGSHRIYQFGILVGCCVLSVVSWQLFHSKFAGTTDVGAYNTYATKAGQRASLTLNDGSKVTLGPLTTLRVQRRKVASNGTTVEVDGEALFNVTHGNNKPFIVNAHGVSTRVLGTEFIVRGYEASMVRIAVRDGRVSVQSPLFTSANAVIVNAGEAVSATPNALPSVTAITDIATDFAWANGELVLRNVPLGEAFVRLSRWYGMEFRVSNPDLLNAKIDAVFPSEFSQMNIDVLGVAIKAPPRRSGNVITF